MEHLLQGLSAHVDQIVAERFAGLQLVGESGLVESVPSQDHVVRTVPDLGADPTRNQRALTNALQSDERTAINLPTAWVKISN